MIENRRGLDIFSHVMLIIGVLVVLFPLYVAFVAATLDDKEVFQVPMTLIPGGICGKTSATFGRAVWATLRCRFRCCCSIA